MDTVYPIKILIVDDRQENIIALEALLERDDVELISTTSPNEALRICWEKDIAIALIDVQMPQMDGFELAEIIKSNQRTRDILIIFVTAISKETKYVVKGFSAGAVDYLYKPLDPHITSAKVDSFIRLVQAQYEIRQKNSELEKYQKELLDAKDKAENEKKIKENFLANMSHEIRTPINGMLGIVHLLDNTELNDEQKNLIHLLELSGQSLLGIVNDILDLSKIEAGKFKIVRSETDIRRLLSGVVELMKFKADEKNIVLKTEIDEKLPSAVIADSLRLNQILMNLISNAIKFTEQGEVVLSAKVLEQHTDTAVLELAVRDTGIGIPCDKLHRIFDSFEQVDEFTAKQFGGTGLGLAIVKKLTALKGGELNVESTKGKGSVFTFTNSFKIVPEMAEKTGTASSLRKFSNIRVLLAEDNEINQFMVKKLLETWNVTVDAVSDGEKAWQKLAEQQYDLILMDTHMPMLDGYEATRKIRSEAPEGKKDIPIISLSANVLEEEMKAALDAGANDVLTKPFEPVALHQKIALFTTHEAVEK